MTHLNGSDAPQGAPSHIALTAPQAKRLVGVLAVSEWPVRYAGHVVHMVQRKRHPYSEWEAITAPSEIDAQNHSVRYRACYNVPTGTAPVNQDLV